MIILQIAAGIILAPYLLVLIVALLSFLARHWLAVLAIGVTLVVFIINLLHHAR